MLRYLRYLLVLLCVTSYCVADQSDTTNSLQAVGKSLCDSDPNMGALQQLLCSSQNGQRMDFGQQIIYINRPPQWRTHKAVNLLDKVGSDYLVTPGIGAHKLHIRKLPWNRARRTCIQEGGHLAIINSNSEEKLLLRVMEENKMTQAWLGVHDLYEEGDWNTILDEPMESSGYAKWTTKIANLPDNAGGKQHCGLLLKDGGMDDLDCAAGQPFFCEINF
ncbi:PREDICTED: hemolymph lipopolysaccharide-binding protein-like isoform X2 [Dinoponera quadriceps]|uniref:Hemolymph lipopolysaccharide-binding protein-like isoform X2 n=1 Tax=Dinoponera quadriceps TaxID=609295 RepID=A0A6P3XW95_DINQU|nr:PREDICTED: hemolymph lipopolysaccharide-binding protein-like isoform X2 [Dinoponera quadriceps]